jgi:hypothetical protein
MRNIVAIVVAIITFGMWVVIPLSKGWVSVMILLLAGGLMWMGYLLPKSRVFLMSLGFYCLMTGGFASYSNWLPQVRGEVPKQVEVAAGDISSMSTDELSKLGEQIIFGREVSGNPNDADVGKGQCPLCHTVSGTVRRDRGPNMTAAEEETHAPIATRGEIRLKDPRYIDFGKQQAEACKGCGRAKSPEEYIAESHVCPSCYVVAGFGVKGTNDSQSPMPQINKPPTSLSIDEFIAVDTYLFTKDGEEPPSPDAIRAAYEKFIPPDERVQTAKKPKGAGGEAEKIVSKLALPTDTPEQIIMKMGCTACHQIPGIPGANLGVIGPMLIEGHNAATRIKSADYKTDMKKSTAAAKTPKEYVMESIMDPNAYVVRKFAPAGNSPMPKNFSERFTMKALNNLADFLLSKDCKSAKEAGLNGPPQEPYAAVCGG